MGRKTRLTIQMLLAALFVMLLTVFLFTDDFIFSQGEEPPTEDVAVDGLEDGTYNGTSEGHNGPIEVEVTVVDGEISEIEILEHNETEGLSDPAFEEVVAAIIAGNSTEVDVVTGATITSEGIIAAVNNALSGTDGEADVEEEPATDGETDEEPSDVTFEDGTYTGSAEGHNGPMEVEVTVVDGVITEVTIVEHEESEGIADPAIEEVPAAIVENNSTEVDTVSGATVSSAAIIAAVNDALGIETAVTPEEPSEYTDGTYTATVEGHNGPLSVEVTVENSVIADVLITEHSETEGLADPAFEEVPAAIMENNSTNVDVVSSATVTSNAIMEAVRTALEDAQ